MLIWWISHSLQGFKNIPNGGCVSQISEPSTIPDHCDLRNKKKTSTSKTLRIAVASQRPKARADCRSPRRIVPWFRCCLGKKPRWFLLGGWFGWCGLSFWKVKVLFIYVYVIYIYMYSRIYMIYLYIYIHLMYITDSDGISICGHCLYNLFVFQ